MELERSWGELGAHRGQAMEFWGIGTGYGIGDRGTGKGLRWRWRWRWGLGKESLGIWGLTVEGAAGVITGAMLHHFGVASS